MAVRTPRALLAAVALAAVPALLLPLPWWTAPRPPVLLTGHGPAVPGEADRWSGLELAGPGRAYCSSHSSSRQACCSARAGSGPRLVAGGGRLRHTGDAGARHPRGRRPIPGEIGARS
jgi:hypothetical protein